MENKFYAFFCVIFFSLAVRGQDSSRCNAAFVASGDGNQVYFRAVDSTGGVSHFWNFGDSTTLGFGNFSAVLHTYSVPGMHTVIHLVRDSANNCRDSASQLVYIPGSAAQCSIDFYYSHDSIHGGPYAFYANANLQGAAADTVTWTVGGAPAGSGDTLTRSLRPGVYTVCVNLSTSLGCRSQYCQTIVVVDSLPGVGTPPDSAVPPVTIVPPDSVASQDSGTLRSDSLSLGSSYITSWPNPSSSEVNIDVPLEKAATIAIRVYNNMGTPVLFKSVAGSSGTNRVTLPIANLQNGIYFIQVQFGNQIKRSRIQKM